MDEGLESDFSCNQVCLQMCDVHNDVHGGYGEIAGTVNITPDNVTKLVYAGLRQKRVVEGNGHRPRMTRSDDEACSIRLYALFKGILRRE
jgi:hypothetical protein